MKKKIAIVCSGGGMRCVYSAGALTALGEHFPAIQPQIAVGGSGSAGSITYYASKQYDAIRDVWTNHLADSKFLSLWRFWKMMNVHYLIDVILKKKAPINANTLRTSPTKIFIPATDLIDGNTTYFTNSCEDIYEAIRAAAAVPIIFNEHVTVGEREYIDGEMGPTFGDYLKKAVEEGADYIIAINTSNKPSMAAKAALHAFALTSYQGLKEAIQIELGRTDKYTLPAHVDMEYIKAPPELPVGLLTHNQERLREAFQVGYDAVLSNPRIEALAKEMS